MNPYEVMGIKNPEAMNPEQFKHALFEAYRSGARTKHPDKGGSNEEWLEFQEAHNILRDSARRERYDATGATRETKATPERVRKYLEVSIKAVVAATTKSGRIDDPVHEDIRARILNTMRNARSDLDNRVMQAQAKLTRTKELIDRFVPVGDEFEDIVGILLANEKQIIEREIEEYDDAKEINVQAIAVFERYRYKVGFPPEGQFNRNPTNPVARDNVTIMTYDEMRQAVMNGDVSMNDVRASTPYRTRPGSFQIDRD